MPQRPSARSLAPLATVACALLLLVLGSPAEARVAGHVRLSYGSGAAFPDVAKTAQRHDVVVLHAWQTERMRALKAADPSLRVLVYKNFGASIGSSVGKYASTGVRQAEAEAGHPEWFLKNRSGERIRFRNYDYLSAMDVGSESYRDRWVENVSSEVVAEGWDGVFMDDVNPTMKYHYDVGQVAKYPSDQAYSAATEQAVRDVGPRLRATGRLVVANIGAWVEYPATGLRWLDYLDGGMEENFVKFRNERDAGYRDERQWQVQVGLMKAAQDRGKLVMGISHSADGDTAAETYGWASMLMAAEGRAFFAMHSGYSTENWNSDYEVELGAPLGEMQGEPGQLRQRRFERGVVLVNPTAVPQTVALAGEYSGRGVTDRSRSVTLAPKSALVLTGRASGPKPPGPRPQPSSPPRRLPAPLPARPPVKRIPVVSAARLRGRKIVIEVACPAGASSCRYRFKARGLGNRRCGSARSSRSLSFSARVGQGKRRVIRRTLPPALARCHRRLAVTGVRSQDATRPSRTRRVISVRAQRRHAGTPKSSR